MSERPRRVRANLLAGRPLPKAQRLHALMHEANIQ